MSYRDELDAAHAQIAMLQEQVASLQAQLSGRGEGGAMRRQIEIQLEEIASLRNLLQSRTTEETASLHRLLKARGEELEQEKINSERLARVLEEQTRELESLRKSTRERLSQPSVPPAVPPASQRVKTLLEHNLRFTPALKKGNSGLLCPRCHAMGESIEMSLGKIEKLLHGGVFSAQEIICPRCLLHEWMRQ